MKAIVLKNTCKADELKVEQIKMPTLKKRQRISKGKCIWNKSFRDYSKSI